IGAPTDKQELFSSARRVHRLDYHRCRQRVQFLGLVIKLDLPVQLKRLDVVLGEECRIFGPAASLRIAAKSYPRGSRNRAPGRHYTQRSRKSLHLTLLHTLGRAHSSGPPKYRSPIPRKNASDSAISPIPFMPSSMLTQPRYWCSARMLKIA